MKLFDLVSMTNVTKMKNPNMTFDECSAIFDDVVTLKFLIYIRNLIIVTMKFPNPWHLLLHV
jgi:hypothetical protein